MTHNMCLNCNNCEVAKTHLCGFKDWCEECDTSLWSTRDVTTTTTTATATTEDEELDYCEECYKTVREIFIVDDVNLQGLYLVNDHHRPKGAKWCTQKCLDLYNVKHPIMIYCKECFARMELTKMVRDFCKICS